MRTYQAIEEQRRNACDDTDDREGHPEILGFPDISHEARMEVRNKTIKDKHLLVIVSNHACPAPPFVSILDEGQQRQTVYALEFLLVSHGGQLSLIIQGSFHRRTIILLRVQH